MPLPRASLRSFLSSAKSALGVSVRQSSQVTFVIGNESADLDSLCSAVVLAYLRTYAPSSQANTLYIPISNLSRADLSLRPELLPVLSRANLKPSDLITLSDLPPISHIAAQLPPENTRWILVDHNALQGRLGQLYGTRVAGCIDHHDEEGAVPKDCGEEPRIVRTSGSCSSLVVEYCTETWNALSAKSDDTEAAAWDVELASLALAPILIDTANLTIASKVTPTDVEALKFLESWRSAESAGTFRRDEYFDQVSAAKQDIGVLSLPDILRKDYKQWTESGSMTLGISSVSKNIRFLIEKAGSEGRFVDVLRKFAKERDLSICSIMTTSNPKQDFKRELFILTTDKKGVDAAKKFMADSKGKLGLQPWEGGSLDGDGDREWRRCWRQQSVECSRKQVAPLLRTAIVEEVGNSDNFGKL